MKPRRRTCDSSSLRHKFLNNWIKGLRICRNMKKDEVSILERKNVIKLSADVAMASTRNAATQWSRAVLDDAVSSNKVMVEQMLGYKVENRLMACSRKILRRSRMGGRRKARRVVPKCVAEKVVKSRTRVLRKLVPGGEEMDGASLIRETLDYIVSLRVQVDVMRNLAAILPLD